MHISVLSRRHYFKSMQFCVICESQSISWYRRRALVSCVWFTSWFCLGFFVTNNLRFPVIYTFSSFILWRDTIYYFLAILDFLHILATTDTARLQTRVLLGHSKQAFLRATFLSNELSDFANARTYFQFIVFRRVSSVYTWWILLHFILYV